MFKSNFHITGYSKYVYLKSLKYFEIMISIWHMQLISNLWY